MWGTRVRVVDLDKQNSWHNDVGGKGESGGQRREVKGPEAVSLRLSASEEWGCRQGPTSAKWRPIINAKLIAAVRKNSTRAWSSHY
jgi:hypothetical protein